MPVAGMLGTRKLLLLPLIAAALLAAAPPVAADHGTSEDCTGAGDFCIPEGVGSVLFFKQTEDCQFDADIQWGDGQSQTVTNFQDGQQVFHTYTTHEVFQVSVDTSATPLVEGAMCLPQDGSFTYEVPPPIIVTPNFTATAGTETATTRPFSFNASSTTKEPSDVNLQYDWDFGDGASGSGQSTSHAYACSPSGDKPVTVSLGIVATRGNATKLLAITKQITVRKCDPQCSDGLDNDGDGRTDHPGDRGCSSATDDSESPDPVVGGPEQNACLKPNAYGLGPDERREYDILEQQWRALAQGLKESAQHLDIFWHLEQFEKSGLTKQLGDAVEKTQRLLRVAEANARAADARVRTTQGFLDEVNRALRIEGTKTPRGRAHLAEKNRLTKELKIRKQAQSQATKALDQLKRSRLGDLAVKLRDPRVKKLQNTLKDLDKLRRQAKDFIKRNPAAKHLFQFLNKANLASELTTYGAWAAELIANHYRDWRRPPEGCTQFFEPPPTSVEPSAASLAYASAGSKYQPGVIPAAELPAALTGGKLPPAAWALRGRLAELSTLVPAVGSALRDRDRKAAAETALKRTVPRLRTLVLGLGSLRTRAVKALKIQPRKVSAKDLARYRPQAPSRNALALLQEGGAPRALRTDLGALFRTDSPPTGTLDPMKSLTDPAFRRLEAELAETLRTLR